MKKKYWAILLIIILIGIGGMIFYKKSLKLNKMGNNKSSQEVVDCILNLSSYETKITVTVTSNKNTNKYILKQEFQSPNMSTQEVIEPSNITGIKIINDGTTLKLENTNLNLNKILENTGIGVTIPEYGETYQLDDELRIVNRIKIKKTLTLKNEVLERLEKLKDELADMEVMVKEDMTDDELRDEDIFRINEKIKDLEQQILNVVEG